MPFVDNVINNTNGFRGNCILFVLTSFILNNTIKLYCPGPGNSFWIFEYRSREIKIHKNELLKLYVNINHNKNVIQD